ncbi:MAG: hypothetical protein M1576_00195 [Deltaproteobacteria bacterium]|nr:hypothetical protein [Deltaproteobacteria bacterium]
MGILQKNENINNVFRLIADANLSDTAVKLNVSYPAGYSINEINEILSKNENWKDLVKAAQDTLSEIYEPAAVMSKQSVKYCRLDNNGKVQSIYMKPLGDTDGEPECYEGILFTEEEIEIVEKTISILDELIDDGCNIYQIVNARDILRKVIENVKESGCQL